MVNENYLDFDRIAYLTNPEQLRDTRVTIVGLGSGGAPVCDHLTMNGVRRWDLYDPDTLGPENLVKHPRQRQDLHRLKVDIQKDWILDRNPQAEVRAFPEDIFDSANFIESVRQSDLVLSCPDNRAAREYISEVCVELGKPFVMASVFRTGIGGEIYGYTPGQTGCLRCMQIYALKNNLNLSDEALGLTDNEQQRIYGLNQTEYRASGLSLDIQMISLIQARMALSRLLGNVPSALPRLRSNWIIFGNRPGMGIFKSHFETTQLLLKPQSSCNCGSYMAPTRSLQGGSLVYTR